MDYSGARTPDGRCRIWLILDGRERYGLVDRCVRWGIVKEILFFSLEKLRKLVVLVCFLVQVLGCEILAR